MGNDEEYGILKNALEQIASFGTTPQGAAHLVDVGSGGYLEYFKKEVIEELIATGGATCKFFEGAYGSGKSHILQMLRELSLNLGLTVASTDLSQAVGFSDWKLITEYILQNIEARIDGQIVRSLPEILAAWGRKNIDPDIEALKKETLPCPGFKNAMIYAAGKEKLNEYSWEKIKQYLLGRKVSSINLKGCGLTGIKGNLTHNNAEYVLKTVLGGLYYLGFAGTCLLFDENEKTLAGNQRIPSKKNLIAANLMRRLIDGCSNGLMTGTVVVFAVLPGFLENCSMNYPALGQRLQIVRDRIRKPSWRWPVLPVDSLNTTGKPEDFLHNCIMMFAGIVKKLGGNIKGLDIIMENNGQSVLEANVGPGYRRELMKTLSSLALERL